MTLFQKGYRVLLINPKTPPSYWGFQESTWFLGARSAHIPLPLITVAADCTITGAGNMANLQ